MKILKNKITFLLLLTLLFASCSSDNDDDIIKTEDTFSGVCESSVLVYGYANQSITSAESSNTLDNMLRTYNYVSPITTGIFLTNTTVVEINGMKDGMILDNFSLKMNGEIYPYGTVTYRDTILYSQNIPQTVNFYKGAFDRMMKDEKQKQVVSVTFTPKQDISQEANVKVNIKLGGAFTYWK